MDRKTLIGQVEQLFSKRGTYMSLLQELSENFYPERADFTTKRTIGENWADNLSTSYPIIVRRELGDQFGQMLRPTGKEWFHVEAADDERNTPDAKRWLQNAEKSMRKAIADPKNLFANAMVQADHDYATFGETVTSCRLSAKRDHMVYRCYHLRDCVWMEDDDGKICLFAYRWQAQAHDLVSRFKNVSSKVSNKANKEPFAEIKCYHICVRDELYEVESKRKLGWVSLYWDADHEYPMEEIPYWRCIYDVSRWQTVSGSQYAYSPAAITALPEARLIQAMTYTLLEAGEKAVNPPMIAIDEAIKTEIEIFAGGITWADMDYDERLGEVLRPITQDLRGLPLGKELLSDSRTIITHAFFLNKLKAFNPDQDPQMTAFQAGQIVQEYIRNALPIFAPMEHERNGKTCEATFQLMFREGVFGPFHMIPPSLQGAEVQFQFMSPLHDLIESQKGRKFLEVKQMLREAAELDQNSLAVMDVEKALREALSGIRTPETWVRDETTTQQVQQAWQAQQQAAQVAQLAESGTKSLANVGSAAKDMAEAA